MPKKLREYPIYIAPEIQGVLINGTPDVDDEQNQNLTSIILMIKLLFSA